MAGPEPWYVGASLQFAAARGGNNGSTVFLDDVKLVTTPRLIQVKTLVETVQLKVSPKVWSILTESNGNPSKLGRKFCDVIHGWA